jgi:hypothetical protein
MAWFVRLLMTLTSIVSWPVAKLLDLVLGEEHHAMFRRKQVSGSVCERVSKRVGPQTGEDSDLTG